MKTLRLNPFEPKSLGLDPEAYDRLCRQLVLYWGPALEPALGRARRFHAARGRLRSWLSRVSSPRARPALVRRGERLLSNVELYHRRLTQLLDQWSDGGDRGQATREAALWKHTLDLQVDALRSSYRAAAERVDAATPSQPASRAAAPRAETVIAPPATEKVAAPVADETVDAPPPPSREPGEASLQPRRLAQQGPSRTAASRRRPRCTEEMIGQCVGNYMLVEQLGSGGMGAVFRAEHPQIGRQVAVKVIRGRRALKSGSADRFLAEARAVARIEHPGVIEIYDFGATAQGDLYCIMELLHGRELSHVIREQAPMSPQQVRPYVEQIVSALAAAHACGVVHRDLKPQNVFVCATPRGATSADADGDHGRVKLLDFGLAKLLGDGPDIGLTCTGMVMGTPLAIAPEQAAGEIDRIGPATDVYAFGVMLFQMLTGAPPFQASSAMALIARHLRDDAPSLATLRPDLSASVVAVVDRCLLKAPEDRPSLREIAAVFASVAAVAAARPSREPAKHDDELPPAMSTTTLRASTGQVVAAAAEAASPTVSPTAVRLRRIGLALAAAAVVATAAFSGSTRSLGDADDLASRARRATALEVDIDQPRFGPPLRGARCEIRVDGVAARRTELPCAHTVAAGAAVAVRVTWGALATPWRRGVARAPWRLHVVRRRGGALALAPRPSTSSSRGLTN